MRPKSLAEVARWVLEGEPFDPVLASFLDGFYSKPAQEALEEEPPLLGPKFGKLGRVQDAYLAATAEELARVYNFRYGTWALDECRKLREPWFASQLASLRAILIHESPAAFRSRNIFVSENALSRA